MSFSLANIVALFKNKKYLYTIEADNNYYYTNNDADQSIDGVLYEAEYISHSNVKSTANEVRSKVDIRFDISNAFIQNLLENNITKKIRITIIEVYNTVQFPIFFGEVDDVTVEQDEVSLSLAPIALNIQLIANKYSYQSSCNHEFLSAYCGVSLTANSTTVTVLGTEKNKTVIELSEVSELFKNGVLITQNNESRMILDVDIATRKVTLLSSLNVIVETNITAQNGCNKTTETCTQYGGNFLGSAYVPNRNIFVSGL